MVMSADQAFDEEFQKEHPGKDSKAPERDKRGKKLPKELIAAMMGGNADKLPPEVLADPDAMAAMHGVIGNGGVARMLDPAAGRSSTGESDGTPQPKSSAGAAADMAGHQGPDMSDLLVGAGGAASAGLAQRTQSRVSDGQPQATPGPDPVDLTPAMNLPAHEPIPQAAPVNDAASGVPQAAPAVDPGASLDQATKTPAPATTPAAPIKDPTNAMGPKDNLPAGGIDAGAKLDPPAAKPLVPTDVAPQKPAVDDRANDGRMDPHANPATPPITDPSRAPGHNGPKAVPDLPGPATKPPVDETKPNIPGPADAPVVDPNATGPKPVPPVGPVPDAKKPDPTKDPAKPDPTADPAQPDANATPDPNAPAPGAPGKKPGAPGQPVPDQDPKKKPVNEGPSKDAKEEAAKGPKAKDEVGPNKPDKETGPTAPQPVPDGPSAAPGPVQVAPPQANVDTGPGGTLEGYMQAHPDRGAEERVSNLGSVNSRSEQRARSLSANVPKAPDRSFLLTLGVDKDWASLQKGLKTNPFNGEGSALEFITKLNSVLDFVQSAASKIGLVATIGGAILTFLIPPVGAFLLTVGRVANAVSLAVSALRVVTSIISTVMMAVRIAKEADPVKRLEIAQMMRAEIQAGVGAGLDLVLSKLGGKAKGTAKVGGKKATDAMKAAWKDGKGLGKVTGAMKAGGGQFTRNIGTSVKEGVDGLRGNMRMMKKLGPMGTLRAGARHGKASLKENFVKPFADVKEAVGDFRFVAKDFRDFRALAKTDGYWKAVGKTNFPNLSTAGSTWGDAANAGRLDKIKHYAGAAKSDLLDATGGGYATRVYAGMNGVQSGSATKAQNAKATLNNPASVQVKKQKLTAMEDALAGNSQNRKVTALANSATPDGYSTKGVLSDELYDMGKAQNSAALKSYSYRYRNGTQLTEETLNTQLKLQIDTAKRELLLFDVKGAALPMAMATISPDASITKSGLAGTGKLGTAMSGFMVDQKTATEAKKPGMVDEQKAALKKQADAEMTSYVADIQSESMQGETAGKVDLILAAAAPSLDARALQLDQVLHAQTGGKKSAGTQAYEPPPPAPPEGTVVPSADLLPRIGEERGRIKSIRAQVEGDVKNASEMKAVAEEALKKATAAKLNLGKASQVFDKQKADATKDQQDIGKAKAKNTEAQAKLGASKGKAEGEKGKAESKANEGRGVTATPDRGKKDAEERKKAEADKRKYDAEYSRAGWFKRRKMDAQKMWASFTSFLARAADWVWQKMIAPAIAAVKAALGKVMNTITELIMKGVLAVVKVFLSEEEKKRLDSTMLEMKEQQAKQAQAQVLQSQQETQKTTGKAGEAETLARSEIARCDGNISEGKGILAELSANDEALAAEATKTNGARAAFTAQYKPYFDWVARNDARKAKATEDIAAGKDPGEDISVHPADRPLAPQVKASIHQAADVIAGDSKVAEQQVVTRTVATRDQVKAKASAFDDEPGKRSALENGADDLANQTVANHANVEGSRRTRLAGMKTRASVLAGMKGSEAISKVKEIEAALSEEASGIDVAKSKALTEMRAGFVELVRSRG